MIDTVEFKVVLIEKNAFEIIEYSSAYLGSWFLLDS